MKRFLVGLLLSALPLISFAQSNFQKGYVITNTKDTLKGYIDYKERSRNPERVTFKTSLTGNSEIYNLINCDAYGIDGIEHQRRFLVDISMNEIELSKLSAERDSSYRRDSVFLKVIQEGKNLTLFSYADELKVRFYILEKDAQVPVELIRVLYLNNANIMQVKYDVKYARQLQTIMVKNDIEGISDKQLSGLRYTMPALLEVVSVINGQQPIKPKYKWSRFFVGAALNTSKASFTGEHLMASEQVENKVSYFPMLNTGMDVFLNPAIGRLIFRTELSLMMNKYNSSLSSEDGNIILTKFTFDQTTAIVTPQFIYNIYNTSKLKFFVGLGTRFNFSTTSNNKMYRLKHYEDGYTVRENEIDINSFNFSFLFNTGIVLNKKIEVSAGYSPNVAVNSYQYFATTIQSLRFGVNYLFGKH